MLNRSETTNFRLFQLTAVAFSLVVAHDLLSFFLRSTSLTTLWSEHPNPYFLADVCFLLWLIPLFRTKPLGACLPLSIAGTALSALSLGTTVHFLGHVGLACSIAGLISFRRETSLWLLGAVSWMPAVIWFSMRLGIAGYDPLLRLIIALPTTGVILATTRRPSYENC